MTILPKKKQSKEKTENEGAEGPHSPPAADAGRGAMARSRAASPGTQRWASPPPVDHDRLPGHDPPGRYEEGSSGHSSIGANKRRMRDRSPSHRTARKQRHESLRGGLQGSSTGGHSSMSGYCHGGRASGLRMLPASTGVEARTSSGSVALPSNLGGEEELNSGYNSEDECNRPVDPKAAEIEKDFEMMLKEKRGFTIKRMGEDGACLFRAVADQVYGDQEMHSIVRQNCVDYMAKNVDFFKQFVTEDFTTYLNRKRSEHCHGNHIEMQALCELYNRPIEVYQSSLDPINTFHAAYETDNEPIRLSYHGNVHYNSVVDPYKATIGVGLGLPGFQPGLAEKNLVRDAVRQSEDCHIEQTMLEDKLRETDWELTQETIEEQVARESYLQWLQEQDKYAKTRTSPRSACATCSTASDVQQQNWWDATGSPAEHRQSRSPRLQGTSGSGGSSPKQIDANADQPQLLVSRSTIDIAQPPISPILPCTSSSGEMSSARGSSAEGGAVGGVGFHETASLMNDLPPQLFGLSEWDDDEDSVLARVIAESQQEYLNGLKLAALSGNSPNQRSPSDKGKSLMPKDSKHC